MRYPKSRAAVTPKSFAFIIKQFPPLTRDYLSASCDEQTTQQA
jgi:hypothetical protein